jgi:hypothetical protein
MAKQLVPNLFQLSGESITATYSTTSIDGQPRFTYKKGRQTLNFAGSDIETANIGIGTLVERGSWPHSAKSSTTFSILLPSIQLTDTRKQAFRTIGITTVTATTIAGPPAGVQQTIRRSRSADRQSRSTSDTQHDDKREECYAMTLRRSRYTSVFTLVAGVLAVLWGIGITRAQQRELRHGLAGLRRQC